MEIIYNREEVKVSRTRDKKVCNLLELSISTIVVVWNLFQEESQTNIVKTIKNVYGKTTKKGINLGHSSRHMDDKQSGCAMYNAL